MPRSSRHKSSHKHSTKDVKDYTDSDSEGSLKERKVREEPLVSSGIRVSRKDPDRWNGSDDGRVEGGKGAKGEVFGPKSKVSVESKSRYSRRNESLSEWKDEDAVLLVEKEEPKKGSVKVEPKRKLEKDLSRKDAHQYKDVKEKERGIERDENVQEVDAVTAAVGVSESIRKQELQKQDDLRNPELEKDLEKRIRRRRDGSGDKDKLPGDVQDGDDRRLSSRDDCLKNGRYKDERQKDGRYKDERHKYREDLDGDHKYKDDKHRDERSSRDQPSERHENKNFRDERKPAESRHKKTKLYDSDRDGNPYVDERGAGYKDNKGRKRYSNDSEGHSDRKSRSTKEHRTEVEKNSLGNSKQDSLTDRRRTESHYHHSDVADSTPSSSSQLKRPPSSSAHASKDQYRHGSKQGESASKEMSEERLGSNISSTREHVSAFGITEGISDSRSMEKPKQKDDTPVGELSAENAPASQSERSPTSGCVGSPVHLAEKSPSSTSGDRRHSNRTGVRRSFDFEDRGRDFPFEKPAIDEVSQVEPPNGESTCGSSFNKTGLFSSRSPSLPPPPPPFRVGVDGFSVLGSSEEDGRGQGGDRKSNNRYKRNGDPVMGRGQGNAWKSIPNWPPPVGNGFIPFQHGPPPSGFHAVVQQFPAPLFGVRPSMELNHSGVSYQMHDTDRFVDHSLPFGWRNLADDSQLHGWDGSNGVFGDESRIYGRPNWDQNRHLMTSRGWEMSDLCKGQNGSSNMEFPEPQKEQGFLAHAPADETRAGQSSHQSWNERNPPESLPVESIEIKQSDITTPPSKSNLEAPLKIVCKKNPEPAKLPSHDVTARFCHVYLSKLDISVDLAHPDLYKQCMSVLGMDGDTNGDCIATNFMHTKETEIEIKSSHNSLGDSLFPATTEVVFQRAMALYKTQTEEMKSKTLFRGPGVENASQASDKEKAGDVEDSLNPATKATSSPRNLDGENSCSNLKGDLSTDGNERPSDNIACDVDGIEQPSDNIACDVIAYGSSQANEALMTESIECQVNFSRIHNSPESTH
ncbi:uncharacterized protein LOC143847565 [Tasmannia lanceolata]|uniref:uncharacterized protein LOC143847565 n=1 Tax=Tasmannia lanceolata TaxID=3420 RepID=UPI004062BF32